MIRAVIIDDEKNSIINLERLLQKHCPEVQLSGSALNAGEGRNLILQQQPDLVFLDIQMPGKNGFDLLKSLPRYDFDIIFVTAFDKYGIQAVKFAAIDYLLKPVNVQELKAAVEKVTERNSRKRKNAQLENLVQLLQQQQQKEEHRIALPSGKEMRFVHPGEIMRCMSSNSYTRFYFDNGEELIVAYPIFEYEALLKDYGFIRCHQSHLVNKRFVKSWLKEGGNYLLLTDGSQIPVSRQKKESVSKALMTVK